MQKIGTRKWDACKLPRCFGGLPMQRAKQEGTYVLTIYVDVHSVKQTSTAGDSIHSRERLQWASSEGPRRAPANCEALDSRAAVSSGPRPGLKKRRALHVPIVF